MAADSAPSVNRELERIGLHIKHAKEFMQMGLPYSEDLLGELTQISRICAKAISKVEEDCKRAETLDAPVSSHYFDDVQEVDGQPDFLGVQFAARCAANCTKD
jgi:hypothetical protein